MILNGCPRVAYHAFYQLSFHCIGGHVNVLLYVRQPPSIKQNLLGDFAAIIIKREHQTF